MARSSMTDDLKRFTRPASPPAGKGHFPSPMPSRFQRKGREEPRSSMGHVPSIGSEAPRFGLKGKK